ncbi:hypothetical protein ACES2L_13515 [Bdellovibrio bacteriovorus]
MKTLILFILLLPATGFSQEVLIRNQSSSPLQYQVFLNEHKRFVSFIDYNHAKLQKNPAQEDSLFQLSEVFNQNPKLVFEEIKKIQEQAPLTLVSLRFIRDLADKLLNQKGNADFKKEISAIYCKTISLLNEGPALHSCDLSTLTLLHLQKRFPHLERLVIESFAFDPQDNVILATNSPYQWTLLSNSHKAIRFYGTYAQLQNQHFVFEALAQGSCAEPALPNDLDFEIMETSSVFFTKECLVKTSSKDKRSNSFFTKKTWLYAAGIAVFSGIVYSMKDKTLVIDASALK